MGKFEFLRVRGHDVILEIHVQPRAGKNEIVGIHKGCLKLRLKAPPVEGEANRECLKFLSQILRLSRSQLAIFQGERSRQKSIRIVEAQLDELEKRFTEILRV